MTDEDEPGPTQAQRFGRFTSQAAREVGYDIDSPRGGGKKALARDAGMSAASVSRMLAGIAIPLPRYFGPLAIALHVSLRKVMIEAGVVSEESFAATAAALPPPDGPLTPKRAAEMLGITKPANVELFVTMVENLQGQERDPKNDPSRGVA